MVLFIPDVKEPHPVYPDVLHQYFSEARPKTELLIYLPQEDSETQHIQAIEAILAQYEELDSYVTLQVGEDLDERLLMSAADFFVTTRSRSTVYRTCLADRYHTKILYGTDKPIFQNS